jgi:hypothetical protein
MSTAPRSDRIVQPIPNETLPNIDRNRFRFRAKIDPIHDIDTYPNESEQNIDIDTNLCWYLSKNEILVFTWILQVLIVVALHCFELSTHIFGD